MEYSRVSVGLDDSLLTDSMCTSCILIIVGCVINFTIIKEFTLQSIYIDKVVLFKFSDTEPAQYSEPIAGRLRPLCVTARSLSSVESKLGSQQLKNYVLTLLSEKYFGYKLMVWISNEWSKRGQRQETHSIPTYRIVQKVLRYSFSLVLIQTVWSFTPS